MTSPTTTTSEPSGAVGEDPRVTTLELFFDLVFVFTITQLTIALLREPSWRSVLHVVETLAVIWWMYGGYAWLTNHVTMEGARRRLLLLGGMAGFFIAALAIPHAFAGPAGVWFGAAYLVVNVIHMLLFQQASGAAASAMVGIFRFNVTAAALVLAGGIAGGIAQELLWAAAIVATWVVSRVAVQGAFDISAAHFVERHGLVVLIALGESVVAVGAGVDAQPIGAGLVAVAVLGLGLSALLWWAYFGGDDERAEQALAGEPDTHRRALMALDGFGLCFVVMLLGIVLLAAGERPGIVHAFDRLETAPALELAAGAGLFIGAEAAFRRVLGIGPWRTRTIGALACLATIPVGRYVAASAELAAIVVLIGATLALDGRAGLRRPARRSGRRPRRASPPARPR